MTALIKTEYQYKPLAAGEVRILRLHYRPQDSLNQLQASLCHVSMTSTYECLSYVWGPPDKSHTLFIDGHLLSITNNLYIALSYFASIAQRSNQLDQATGNPVTGPLWVDAICINQKDDAEKSIQVQMMDNIYKGRGVYAWLGPEDPQWTLAINTFRHMSDDLEGNIPLLDQDCNGLDEYMNCVQTWLRSRLFDEHDRATPALTAIQRFCDAAYWTRMWIVQEAFLAGNVYFCCGTSAISRRELAISLGALMQHFHGSCPAHAVHGSGKERISMASASALGLWGPTIENRLWTLLTICHRATYAVVGSRKKTGPIHATDPRDYIFGLAGLFADEFQQIGVHVDYSVSVQAVYSRFAAAYTQGYNALNLLGFAQFPKQVDGLPSWVPDWSMALNAPLSTLACGDYAATGTSQPSLLITQNPWTLDVTGSRIGRVCRVTDLKMGSDADVEAPAILDMVGRMLIDWQGPSPYATDVDSLADVTWRTVLADTEMTNYSAFNSTRVTVGQRTRATDYSKRRVELMLKFLAKFHESGDEVMDDETKAAVASLMVDMSISMVFREAFMLDSGHIGIGPEHLVERDLVVLLAGTPTPHVLRPKDDGMFEYVGEAYVHGLMDGETGSWDTETFGLV